MARGPRIGITKAVDLPLEILRRRQQVPVRQPAGVRSRARLAGGSRRRRRAARAPAGAPSAGAPGSGAGRGGLLLDRRGASSAAAPLPRGTNPPRRASAPPSVGGGRRCRGLLGVAFGVLDALLFLERLVGEHDLAQIRPDRCRRRRASRRTRRPSDSLESGWPTQTQVVISRVAPQNQASPLLSVVPVLPQA